MAYTYNPNETVKLKYLNEFALQLNHKLIAKSLLVVNRGVKYANFFVLKYTDMPAVLVETAFIDNANDAVLLRTKQDDFARAIARGISDFYAFPKPDVIDLPLPSLKRKAPSTFGGCFFCLHHVCKGFDFR